MRNTPRRPGKIVREYGDLADRPPGCPELRRPAERVGPARLNLRRQFRPRGPQPPTIKARLIPIRIHAADCGPQAANESPSRHFPRSKHRRPPARIRNRNGTARTHRNFGSNISLPKRRDDPRRPSESMKQKRRRENDRFFAEESLSSASIRFGRSPASIKGRETLRGVSLPFAPSAATLTAQPPYFRRRTSAPRPDRRTREVPYRPVSDVRRSRSPSDSLTDRPCPGWRLR